MGAKTEHPLGEIKVGKYLWRLSYKHLSDPESNHHHSEDLPLGSPQRLYFEKHWMGSKDNFCREFTNAVGPRSLYAGPVNLLVEKKAFVRAQGAVRIASSLISSPLSKMLLGKNELWKQHSIAAQCRVKASAGISPRLPLSVTAGPTG